MLRIEITSKINGDVEQLSRDLLTMGGVNYEMNPIIKMTAPSDWAKLPISEWPTNTKIFTSTTLLLGIIPIDFHNFNLVSTRPNELVESSSTALNKQWNHRREIREEIAGCSIHDTVEYLPRISILGKVVRPVYQAIFNHRHRRLISKYGASN